MSKGVPFETLLSYLNEHGWEFYGSYRREYRVFMKDKRPPIVFMVDEGKVASADVQEIKERVERDYA